MYRLWASHCPTRVWNGFISKSNRISFILQASQVLTTFCNPPGFGTPEAKTYTWYSRCFATYVRIHVELHCVQAKILHLTCDIIATLRVPSKQIIILTLAYMNVLTVVFAIIFGKSVLHILTPNSKDISRLL